MSGQLDVRVVRDAILVPRDERRPRQSSPGVLQRVAGTVAPVPGTGLRRRGREVIDPPDVRDVRPARWVQRAVFGGYLFPAYGHFLLESLARLWTGGEDPDVPVVWLARAVQPTTLKPWMREIATCIGIQGDVVLVDAPDGPLAVGELVVADPALEVARYVHPAFTTRLAWHDAHLEGAKVWLSRQGLGDEAGGLAEEAELEAELARDGWRSVRLEEHPVEEQARILGSAAHVAGIEGSAFHTLLFVRAFQGTIDIVTRHGNPNYDLIAETTGWDQRRHAAIDPRGRQVPRRKRQRQVRREGTDAAATAALIVKSAARRP